MTLKETEDMEATMTNTHIKGLTGRVDTAANAIEDNTITRVAKAIIKTTNNIIKTISETVVTITEEEIDLTTIRDTKIVTMIITNNTSPQKKRPVVI